MRTLPGRLGGGMGGEGMSLQSRRKVCRKGGEYGRKKSATGPRSRLWNAQRMLDSVIPATARFCTKLEETSLSAQCVIKHRRIPRSPSESFLLPSPGRLSMGLKTQRRVLPRPSSSEADCLFRQVRREVLSRPLCCREPFTLRYFGGNSETI